MIKILDFYAPWCGPCKMLLPIINDLVSKSDKFELIKINIDEEKELSEKYKILSVPTLIFIKDEELIKRIDGFKPAGELKKIFDEM